MGNIYVTCARCNKGMTIAEYNCVFCSDIDNQIVCRDCFDKEQPKELMKKIQELEAKLAESEEAIKYLKGIKRYDIGEMLIENSKLKQQLAEKEEIIGKLNYEVAMKNMDYYIEGAIAELEKVKEWCQESHDGWQTSYNEKLIIDGVCYALKNTISFIDQQIKELKGEK